MIIEEMEKYIQENIPELYNICLYQDGNMLFNKYYQRYSYPDYAVNIKSVSKILLALGVGAMLKEHLIKGVNQTVAELLPDYAADILKDEKEEELKLYHLLTMTSGFSWQESGPSFFEWLKSSDWVSHALYCPRRNKPGTVFLYNTANSHLVSAIIKQQTGENAYDFVRESILKPLGINHALWQKAPEGNDYGGGDFFLAPGNVARIGQLMLKEGVWKNTELLPKGWVKECLTSRISVKEELAYGYFCFGRQNKLVNSKGEAAVIDTWFIPGTGGQYLYIIPKLNATAVITSLLTPNDGRDPINLPAGKLMEQFLLKELYDNKYGNT
ncbi:serine hydrolase [Anaerocolumna sp. AGMB13020]|uniref:serine hydrolase domain-containing protein n=1 Tax=Anaerocolumna sp. AGMB13020 TaxID=3081750 RepID=UPI002953587A|nr:serine hydrolase [Anaerocolumna sp. AGMB13020]WOO34824.1 serine hydrolase [Anaerocolumna sp. AGMB13020]